VAQCGYAIIIAQKEDAHALSVCREIEQLGTAIPLIIDAEDFPSKWQITLDIDDAGASAFTINVDDVEISDSQVTGAWYRRSFAHRVPNTSVEVHDFCRAEATTLFQSWTHALGARLINPRLHQISASHKPLQLLAALSVGLRVPATSMTNCSESVRRLKSRTNQMVYKAFSPIQLPMLIDTRVYSEELDEVLGKLRYAPVIFQERVEKRSELRVTIVDEQVFSAQVEPQHQEAELDWRIDLSADVRHHELPDEIRTKLFRLMRSLGLRYGAIDMAVTDQDEYVFFEVNPSGQFLFVEIQAEMPISNAVAKALCGCR